MDWFAPFIYKCSQDQQDVQQKAITVSGKCVRSTAAVKSQMQSFLDKFVEN